MCWHWIREKIVMHIYPHNKFLVSLPSVETLTVYILSLRQIKSTDLDIGKKKKTTKTIDITFLFVLDIYPSNKCVNALRHSFCIFGSLMFYESIMKTAIIMSYQGRWKRCLSPRTPRWRTPEQLKGWGTWIRQHYPAWSAGQPHGLYRAPWKLDIEWEKFWLVF